MWSYSVLLRYGVGTYAVLLGSYLAACLPFAVLDRSGFATRWRIQPSPPRQDVAAAKRMVVLNFAWLLPAVLAASPLLRLLFPSDAQPPPLASAPFTALAWFVLHDLSFYCYHRTLHEVPWLYVSVHKPHHKFTAPFAWTSHAVHPAEMALQAAGAMAGPLLWARLYGLPVRAWWCWLALVQAQGVMDHSGYDLPAPLDCFGMLPGFGGTRFHDDHHRYFTGNYAAALSLIDDLMGTRLRVEPRGGAGAGRGASAVVRAVEPARWDWKRDGF